MSVDDPYRPPAEPPLEAVMVPARLGQPFPGFWSAVGLCLLFIALQLFGAIALAILMFLVAGPGAAEGATAATLVVVNLFAFAITMWVGVTFGGLEWSKAAPMTPFRGVVVLPTIIAVVGIGILASELDNITRFLLPMPEFIAQLMADIISGGVFAVIALVIVAPLTEELLFRGLILQGFLGRYSTVTAILVSALLFTLVHMNPYQVASAWLMGIYLAWLFILTRSLWPCMIAHALFNSQAIVIPLLRDHLGLRISGYTGPPVPGQPEFQPLWFNLLGIVLLALGLWVTAMTAGRRKFASPGDERGWPEDQRDEQAD